MSVQKLFRAVSKAEFEDWSNTSEFRTSRNTLEAKQFFKSYKAAIDFYNQSLLLNFIPPYSCILEVHIDKAHGKITFDDMDLDTHEALSIEEGKLADFNKCITFVTRHDIRNNI